MKKRTIGQSGLESNICAIACDVGKDDLNYYTEMGGIAFEEYGRKNNTIEIEKDLKSFSDEARKMGYNRCRVVVEATGQYHDNLFRTALRLGLDTAYVNPEAASKMRVIETNDDNKTDQKDPKVIYRLAFLGKTLQHRLLEKHYSWLRVAHHLYNGAEERVVDIKCEIHALLTGIFPDFDFKSDFIYGPSGQALFSEFYGSPYRIIEAGQAKFYQIMQERAPSIRKASLKRLYSCAEVSSRQDRDPQEIAILERQMKYLWEDYRCFSERKMLIKKDMETTYNALRDIDPKLPKAENGFISTFHAARIIAETGPLSDFTSWRQLLKFAGINLRERQSGKLRGRTKLSKKGRCLLRKALGQIVLPLVKRNALYGEYYHSKRAQNVKGTKAMAAVMRKFLKSFFGWYQSGLAFDRNRVFLCKSQFDKKFK